MNANAIITRALRKLVVVPSGGTPSTSQFEDGLELLNDIVTSWSADASFIYEDTREDLIIPAGTQEFTVGLTGDIITTKPIEVINAILKDANNNEYNLLTADVRVYDNYGYKLAIGLPGWLYFRNTFPNTTFYFNTVSDLQYTLVLTSMKELTQFPDGTTEIALPDYYKKAFIDNLTIEIAPEMGAAKRVTPLMVSQAEESKSMIVGKSTKINISTTELSRQTGYNINGDTY